jgi:hypothetical protein
MKTAESDEARAALDGLLEASGRTAGTALADSVAWAPRRMTAAELFEFWREIRLVAMATASHGGQPHMAPVHAELCGDRIRVLVYDDAVRRRDLASNPRVAFSAWNADGAVAMLYGRARELEGSLRDARPSQAGRPRKVVTFEVQLTRVYAMRANASSSPPAPRTDPSADREKTRTPRAPS